MSSVPADAASPTTEAAAESTRGQLFGRGQRAVTTGIVLLITLVAFEGMGVGTAMPAVVADLGAVTLYAWPFVGFLARRCSAPCWAGAGATRADRARR